MADNTTTTRWRPDPTGNAAADLAWKTSFDNVYGLEKAAVLGAVNGMKMASGSKLITGQSKEVVTGLTTVSNVVVSLDTGLTPVFEVASARPSPTFKGSIDIIVTKVGSVLSTTPRLVRWKATGT